MFSIDFILLHTPREFIEAIFIFYDLNLRQFIDNVIGFATCMYYKAFKWPLVKYLHLKVALALHAYKSPSFSKYLKSLPFPTGLWRYLNLFQNFLPTAGAS